MVSKKKKFEEDELENDNLELNDEDLNEEDLNEEDCDDSDDEDGSDDEDETDIMFKFNTNKHKIEGKHSLSRDTIFKGKVEENNEEFEHLTTPSDFNSNDGLPIESGSNYEFESKHNEEYITRLSLQQDVYRLLSENTELDFSSNRRKPNRQAFNDYYQMLLDNIGKEYTKSEIFVELSYYFTDNIFNMFKLLDKERATQIIVELKQSGYLTNLKNINFI
jgi:hypothetical protein